MVEQRLAQDEAVRLVGLDFGVGQFHAHDLSLLHGSIRFRAVPVGQFGYALTNDPLSASDPCGRLPVA